MEATGLALLVLGAVSLIAAIVGGNVALPGGTKFGALGSTGLRVTLAIFAGVLMFGGLALIAFPRLAAGEVSREQYLLTANNLCRESYSTMQQIIRVDPDADQAAETARVISLQLQEHEKLRGNLQSLPKPADSQGLAAAYEAHDRYIDQLKSIVASIYSGAEPDVRADIGENFDAAVREAGLVSCVRPTI